jgi:hypothetical protein
MPRYYLLAVIGFWRHLHENIHVGYWVGIIDLGLLAYSRNFSRGCTRAALHS